ncbi:DgyrCDS12489 [Dimorphilus gyrociliatus]|nr:DgyrCDS12489 [Dimorphilus gyrociliatus]
MYPEISNFPFEDSENVAALLNDIIQEDGFAEGNLPSNLEDDFLIGEFLPLMKQTEEYIDQFRAEGSTVNIVSPTGDQQQGFPLFPGKKYKPPALNHPSLLSSDENIRLAIISQPSEKHRARYPSEGSRGAIKGREHFEYPEIQLQGYFGSSTVTLQIFLANETGNVKPHGLYQAVIVKGRRRRDCITKVIQDTNVLETKLKSSNNYRAK